MNPPVSTQRQRTIQTLTRETLDVLVIGGGIVGSGVARDAAMRGLKTGLVEQHDFAFGTSSRSSRLLHGGLRYLAQGRVGLVREASVEKKILHHIAPHLADPLPFIFPTYRGNRDWVLWQLKIGVKLYDLLCSGRNLGKSSWLNREEVAQRVQGLQAADLTGAVRYYDGFTSDARLVLDTLRSAERAGANLKNYCRFKNARRAEDSTWDCEIEDLLSGQSVTLRARAIVNATGPWADRVPHSQVKLRVTKGVHLVVERSRMPVPETVVMTEGKRILFAIPWGERTILGTTDTDYSGPVDDVRSDAADVSYILRVANQSFPAAKLTADDVISTWAGLRPLQSDLNGKPSEVSRAHEISSPEAGWWDVTGGKLTTYRLMAQETVDRVTHWLGRTHGAQRHIRPCQTAEVPLLAPSETLNLSGVVPPEFSRRVVEHGCAHEWAIHLDDMLVRRTSWHYYHRDAAARAERVADWMAELLGWSDAQRTAELGRYHAITGGCLSSQPSRNPGEPAVAGDAKAAISTEPAPFSR